MKRGVIMSPKHKSLAPKSKSYHRAGRWLSEPKTEHKIILQALEIANRAFMRVVNVSEILQPLSSKEKAILEDNYGSTLSNITSKILLLLCKQGKVFKTEKVGKLYYYGLAGLLNPAEANLNNFQSLRHKVLKLVQVAVVENNRALQMGEIVEFAKNFTEYEKLEPKLISRSVVSLKETGELIKISMRGNEKGFGVYLPKEFNPDTYLPKKPLTWLEFTLNIFNEIWKEHLLQAENNNTKPRPISTGEIRAKIVESKQFPEKLSDPIILVNALQQLAKTNKPSLRKIKRPNEKTLFWLPVDIKDDKVNLGNSYIHDAERLEEAVKRAGLRLARPVCLSEVREEVKNDPALKPISKIAYHTLLSDLARERIAGRNRKTFKSNHNKRIYRTGKLQGTSYYYFSDEPGAIAYIKFRSLEEKWNDLNPSEEITKVESCVLPAVAFGRVKLLAAEINSIGNELKKIQFLEETLGVSNSEMKYFLECVSEMKSRTEEWLKDKNNMSKYLPQKVETIIKGWTSHELQEFITPFYHRARNLKPKTNIQSLLGNAIRRIPNPNLQRANLRDPRSAAEYLYDETDALIYIAKEWGGPESRYQASSAFNELGILRDPRFIIPDLDNKNFSIRLSAVSCLAFLSSEAGNLRLYQTAINDIDVGVRQSALWAYGFSLGESAISFIETRSFKDEDIRVRNFARNLVENYSGKWLDF
jgi:hypothetical protein